MAKQPDPAAPSPAAEDTALPDFSASLPMALLRAREAVTQYFRPMLRRYDLTEQQWRVLRALADHGRLEISELAEHCFILMPSLSRILQKLEERKLVSRKAVEGDQRRASIELSAKGAKLFKATVPEVDACYREIARRFGGERLDELHGLLEGLIADLRRD